MVVPLVEIPTGEPLPLRSSSPHPEVRRANGRQALTITAVTPMMMATDSAIIRPSGVTWGDRFCSASTALRSRLGGLIGGDERTALASARSAGSVRNRQDLAIDSAVVTTCDDAPDNG